MGRTIQNSAKIAGAAGLAVAYAAAMDPSIALTALCSVHETPACGCPGESSADCSHEAAGKPSFVEASGSPVKTGPMPGRPAIGDVNHDGHPDIAVACGTCCGSRPDPASGHVLVLLGDGRGGFRPAGKRIMIGPSALKVVMGDANNDRHPDLLVIEHNTDNLTLLLGDGTGAFSPAPGSPFVHGTGQRPHTHDVAAADVNADGNLDAVVTRCNDNRLAVMLGDGKGGFAPAGGSPLAGGRHPYEGLTLRDITADGKVDAIVANLQGDTVSVLAGDGRGGFSQIPGSPYKVGPRPGTLVVADLNSDGRDDIAATHDDDRLLGVLLADSHGGFKAAEGSPFALNQRVWGIAANDFDGDGNTDLVAAEWSGAVHLLPGNGAGGVTSESVKVPAGDGSGQLAIADLDQDGKTDIVTANYARGDLTVLLAR